MSRPATRIDWAAVRPPSQREALRQREIDLLRDLADVKAKLLELESAPEPEPVASRWLPIAEAAAVLRVHPVTLRRRCEAGQQRARKLGSRWRVDVSDEEVGLSR